MELAGLGDFNCNCVVDLEKGSLGMAIQFSDYDFITTIDVLTCYVLISSSVVQHNIMTKLQTLLMHRINSIGYFFYKIMVYHAY